MTLNTSDILLFFGVILVLAEFFKAPGVGLLFIGLGCLTAGGIFSYYEASATNQVIFASFASLVWVALLWVPMNRYFYNKKTKKNHFNVVGSKVSVAKEFDTNSKGQVKWSGTVMSAIMHPNENASAQVGDELYVVKVKGSLLICSFEKDE